MSTDSQDRQVRCRRCSWSGRCGPERMHQWLAEIGMLRRVKRPDPAILRELFDASTVKLTCPECGGEGLSLEPIHEEDDDWGMARLCASCGKPIPPERLELFADAKMCAACTESGAAGESQEREFCDYCGALMVVRQSRGPGISRYEMVCSECGR